MSPSTPPQIREFMPCQDESSSLELQRTCHDFDRWLCTEAAKAKLEEICQQARVHIDAINAAHERASGEGSTAEDTAAYFQAIPTVDEIDQFHGELDRIAERYPELEKRAEEIRLYVAGLAYHAGR